MSHTRREKHPTTRKEQYIIRSLLGTSRVNTAAEVDVIPPPAVCALSRPRPSPRHPPTTSAHDGRNEIRTMNGAPSLTEAPARGVLTALFPSS